jgi:hypothetical protein
MRPPVSVVRTRPAGLLLLFGIVGLASLASAQSAPHIGRWVLNTGRSVYSPGPPPRSQVRTYSTEDGALKGVIETVQPLGTTTKAEYVARFDGKDYPITGNADVDTIALTRVDEWTFDATMKRRGTVMTTVRNAVSKDGRTMTVTSKGTNARGQPTSSVAVLTKQ